MLDQRQAFARTRPVAPVAEAHSCWQAAARPEVRMAQQSASEACLPALAKASPVEAVASETRLAWFLWGQGIAHEWLRG